MTPVGVSSFKNRGETFGMDTPRPWALESLRLVFSVPRTYLPLAQAWDERYPGTLKALKGLTASGFLIYQKPVIVDIKTGKLAFRCSPPALRYRATAKGRRLRNDALEDSRILVDTFSKISKKGVLGVLKLLDALDLDAQNTQTGISVSHLAVLSGLPERSVRWWVDHLESMKYVVKLPDVLSDVREVVPAHWRVTRDLCKQLKDVLQAFPGNPHSGLVSEFKLNRTKFLENVVPARVGLTGATDYDHDVETQKLLAAFMRSANCASSGIFNVEPRLNLAANMHAHTMVFNSGGKSSVFYQPDAELREVRKGVAYRSIFEYERFQSRRDAWSHIERFFGWLHLRALPSESAVLRFVVNSDSRVQSYVKLVAAYSEYLADNPDRRPNNPVQLAVSSRQRIYASTDPLDDNAWYRVNIIGANSGGPKPVLHLKDTPYDEYVNG